MERVLSAVPYPTLPITITITITTTITSYGSGTSEQSLRHESAECRVRCTLV